MQANICFPKSATEGFGVFLQCLESVCMVNNLGDDAKIIQRCIFISLKVKTITELHVPVIALDRFFFHRLKVLWLFHDIYAALTQKTPTKTLCADTNLFQASNNLRRDAPFT